MINELANKRITEKLAELHQTKADLAKQIGVEPSHLSKVLSARTLVSPERRKRDLAKIAEALNIDLSELLTPAKEESEAISILGRPRIGPTSAPGLGTTSVIGKLFADAEILQRERGSADRLMVYIGGEMMSDPINASIMKLLKSGCDVRRFFPKPGDAIGVFMQAGTMIGLGPSSYEAWEIDYPGPISFMLVPGISLVVWFGDEASAFQLSFTEPKPLEQLARGLNLLCRNRPVFRAYSAGDPDDRDYRRVVDFETVLVTEESGIESSDKGIMTVMDGPSSAWVDPETFDRRSKKALADLGESSSAQLLRASIDDMRECHAQRFLRTRHSDTPTRQIVALSSLNSFARVGTPPRDDPFGTVTFRADERIRILRQLNERLEKRPHFELAFVDETADLPFPGSHDPVFWELTRGKRTQTLFVETYAPDERSKGDGSGRTVEVRFVLSMDKMMPPFVSAFEDAWSKVDKGRDEIRRQVRRLLDDATGALLEEGQEGSDPAVLARA